MKTSGAIAGNSTRYAPRDAALGTTVEDQRRANKNVRAVSKQSISAGRLLPPCRANLCWAIDLHEVIPEPHAWSHACGFDGLDWVIAGRETGQGQHKARCEL